ncbi:MAG: lipid A biosynthesis acyltransferase [Betaproteobacteria bacterium]|nr:lipid A biosynthesis acyltransferase [Betaproteobacteria bacterium]
MARIAIAALWLLHFLPLPWLARIGRVLGFILYSSAAKRRRIGRINLRLCFPELDDRARERLLRRHFAAIAQSLLDRGVLWWSSEARIRQCVRVEGQEHMDAVRGRPVIWLAPHFVGLDMGGVRISVDYQVVSIYAKQKNPLFDALFLRGRMRLGSPLLLSRQDGVRAVVRALKAGMPFYYLPDMDYGPRDAIFVPFFGVPAATITGMSRLAKLSGAVVVPCVTRQRADDKGYVVRFYPPWQDYPSDELEADTRRMNAFVEDRVREMPEQYHWLHKRFKTRPAGEAGFYEGIKKNTRRKGG